MKKRFQIELNNTPMGVYEATNKKSAMNKFVEDSGISEEDKSNVTCKELTEAEFKELVRVGYCDIDGCI